MLLKKSSLKWLLLFIAVFGLTTIYYINWNLPGFLDIFLDFSAEALRQHDAQVRESIHFSKFEFSLTDAIKPVDMLWDAFAQKPLEQQCMDFFKGVDHSWGPEWELPLLQDRSHDKLVARKQKYFERAVCIIKVKEGLIESEDLCDEHLENIPSDFRAQKNEEYIRNMNNAVELENEIADIMTVYRIFGRCFFDKDHLRDSPLLKDTYNRWSEKLLPRLSRDIPLVEGGDILSNTESDYYNAADLDDGQNLLNYYHDNSKGSGIVISCGTHHSRDVVKLIHTLRALNNELPIQIIYRNDLLSLSMNAIQYAATVSKNQLLGPVFSNVNILETLLKNIGMKILDLLDLPFPPQRVSLINILKTLSKFDSKDLADYRSKIAALLFTSYENVLLFDADAVPLIKPADFFDFPQYKQNGAYFFRDRSHMVNNDWQETNFFAKLMPHTTNRLDMAMGVKPVSSITMNNQYMRGWRHMQEAGIVAFNRKRHFKSLISLFPLSIWKLPIEVSIWGDKELYWLAMSAAGDEDYYVHPVDAAAVGELTQKSELKHYDTPMVNELCSTHPGHVSSEGKLLWINSGFSFCKKNPYHLDLGKFPFSVFETEAEVAEIYEAPLRLRHALVPPTLPRLRSGTPDIEEETAMLKYIKENANDFQDLQVDQIHDRKPFKTWFMIQICTGHLQCAYDVSLMKFEGNTNRNGEVITFSQQDSKFFDMIGAIWQSAQRVIQLPQDYTPEAENDYESKSQVPEIQNLKIDLLPLTLDSTPYDPSQARERPEKLSLDVNHLLKELLSGDNEENKSEDENVNEDMN